MSDSKHLTVQCPCCDALLVVDAATAAVISHREAERQPAGGKTLESLFAHHDEEKDRRESLFEREVASMKDKDRLLEEKFQEAMRRVEEEDDDSRPVRPFDLD
jgi:hypothetical protein